MDYGSMLLIGHRIIELLGGNGHVRRQQSRTLDSGCGRRRDVRRRRRFDRVVADALGRNQRRRTRHHQWPYDT